MPFLFSEWFSDRVYEENLLLFLQRKNSMIDDNVLETCKEVNVKKVVSVLSTCIFPEDLECPALDESMVC